MPESRVIAEEVTIGNSPREVHRDLLLSAVPIFASAQYKLASSSGNTIVLERKFLPGLVQKACLAVIAVLVIVQWGAGSETTPAVVVGWIAILTMVFYRRRENLTLDLRPEHDGTRLIAVGSASKKGHAALNRVVSSMATAVPNL